MEITLGLCWAKCLATALLLKTVTKKGRVISHVLGLQTPVRLETRFDSAPSSFPGQLGGGGAGGSVSQDSWYWGR